MDFANRVWVVTGASSGIGRQTALDVARRGAKVCVAARRRDRLEPLVEEMGGPNRGHTYKVTDVSIRDDVRALAAHVEDAYGRCDVLLNNAGRNLERRFDGPGAIDSVEEIFATNFFGAVYAMGEFMGLLERSAPSHVVNVASMAGRIAVGFPAYAASKFALVGWSEALHHELAQKGIHVSSVEPGFIPTEGFPQDDLKRDPLMRRMLGTTEGVSAAIQDAVKTKKMQRVVPRWYYLLQIPKLLTPPLFRYGTDKLVAPRAQRRSAPS